MSNWFKCFKNCCHECGCSCECLHDCKGNPTNCTSQIKCTHHCGCYLDVLALTLREDRGPQKIPTGSKRNKKI